MIGNGVVDRPGGAVRGARRARSRAASTSAALKVSANAHVIADYNRTIDKVTERFLGSRRIGTTGRGIGPTYADKMNRIGIRVQDLFDEKILTQKVEGVLDAQEPGAGQDLQPPRARRSSRSSRSCSSYADRLRPMVVRHRAAAQPGARPRRDRAARGRPGHAARRRPRHLPVRHLVLGDRRRRLHRVRHPADPDRPGDRDRQGLHDPRRRGPVPDRAARRRRRAACARSAPSSAPPPAGRAAAAGTTRSIARYAARVNGVTDFVLTKLDVLTGLEKVPVCVAYDVDGVRHDEMPMTQTEFHHAMPVYEYFDGWWEDISGAPHVRRPARRTRRRTSRRSRRCPAPGSRRVGVGPSRDATVVTRHDAALIVLDPVVAIDRLRAAFRGPAGHRALHAKGRFYGGTFTATARGGGAVPRRPPGGDADAGAGALVERRAGNAGARQEAGHPRHGGEVPARPTARRPTCSARPSPRFPTDSPEEFVALTEASLKPRDVPALPGPAPAAVPAILAGVRAKAVALAR